MIKERLHFKIEPEGLRIYLAGNQYAVLNNHLATILDHRTALRMIISLDLPQSKLQSGAVEDMGIEVSELRVLYEKLEVYLRCYEEERTFEEYTDLLSAVNATIREDLLKMGFICENKSGVEFHRADCSLNFVDDRDGLGLYIIDNVTKKFYESMLMLEQIDWDVANTYKLRMRRYEAELPSGARKTAKLLAITNFVKLNFMTILAKGNKQSLLDRIAVESRFKRELSERIFSASKNDPIRQSFLENNFQLFINKENS
jgi:hypothetical protein